MKRFWIGICVLAVLLAAGIAVTYVMERCHEPISRELDAASQAVLAGDWNRAVGSAEAAFEKWQRCRDFTAAFADHSVLEEVECLFAQIQVFAAGRDTLSFAAACAHLSRLTDAVAQSHLPKWQNLL